MRTLAVVAAVLAMLLAPGVAEAQPPCRPGAFEQHDMAGVYESMQSQMRLTVFGCGGAHLLWSNHYGTHEATYYGVERLEGGGVIARVWVPDPYVRSLDGRNVLSFKPAEAGYIQVMTLGPFGDDVRSYRLAKLRQ